MRSSRLHHRHGKKSMHGAEAATSQSSHVAHGNAGYDPQNLHITQQALTSAVVSLQCWGGGEEADPAWNFRSWNLSMPSKEGIASKCWEWEFIGSPYMA
eukprot:scaffold46581_cov21-Tisochrysis_lutea.AAC.3